MESAPETVLELIERFAANRTAYRSSAYNEARLRIEFLNPFFEALGWDVSNRRGYAEAYKDVIYEDAIKIAGTPKAPDYCFRIGGTRKFFVEAKKPALNLKDDRSSAFQLRRYGWSAKLPLSILTDFEEFSVYDCRIKPDQTDQAAKARTFYCTFEEYPKRWEEIASIFSREAVLKGSFDTYAESAKAKHGTAEVDTAFLKEIESWRELLAKNLAARNRELTQRQLNYSVQMTIDRIIFLRICEDRGIEEYGRLRQLLTGSSVYPRLTHLFEQADDRYNSGLFHFRREKERPEPPDDLTLSLTISDQPLKDIIRRLYYPDSPYEFSVLPSDVLGHVYEQFLGKVIHIGSNRRVEIEEKPEVRKAGGVYYTPTYIVDYIVKHTIGKLLEGKKPGSRGGVSKLKILDPACGSGSFLLGAYQFLIDWHVEEYLKDGAEKHPKELYQGAGGQWLLTTQEKKRILLNNIYGVDIDSQAVEVTKLSLLLKMLEGKSDQTLVRQLVMFHERVLPDLDNNIKCGNSLIDSRFYGNNQMSFLDQETQYRINVFDWISAFPQVFSGENPGFDAVIGNPPYIRIQMLKEWAPIEVEYYKKTYDTAAKGNYDIYVAFVERGLSLLNKTGRLGFIQPNKFFNAQYGEPLRRLIASGKYLSEVVNFGDEQVFSGATTYTCLLLLNKAGSPQCHVVQVDDLTAWKNSGEAEQGIVPATSITAVAWNFATGEGGALLERLLSMPTKLEDVTSRIFQGIKTSADKIYIVEERVREEGRIKIYSPQKDAEYWLEPDLLHPLIKGGDSKRYRLAQTKRLILFPYAPQANGTTQLIPADTFQGRYPLTWAYLQDNQAYLENREHGRMVGERWYGYIYPKALDVMPLPKIFTPDIAMHASFSLDETGAAFFTGGVAGGYGILVLPEYSREYILGLLNSKLLEWFIRQTASRMRGGYYSFESRFIRNLPIRTINSADPTEKAQHDRLVDLVERTLELHKQLSAARVSHEKAMIQRQIEATDKQIDRLVYELYGLTAEEIQIVEAGTQTQASGVPADVELVS